MSNHLELSFSVFSAVKLLMMMMMIGVLGCIDFNGHSAGGKAVKNFFGKDVVAHANG